MCGVTPTLLMDRGADVNARGKWGRTPLHWACACGVEAVAGTVPDTARLLIEKGADVDARDNEGRTPLHVACRYGSINVATLLLDRGANVGARDNEGETPLDFACGLPESDTARELLLEAFQELAPEAYFTKFCESPGRMTGRGM